MREELRTHTREGKAIYMTIICSCNRKKTQRQSSVHGRKHIYRMAPNFQGAQFSWIGLPPVFVEIIFADPA